MRPTSTHTERKEIKKKKKEETPLKERERERERDGGTPAMQNERDHCRLNVECLPADTIWLYSSQTDQPCLSLDRRTLPSGRKSSNKTRMVISLLFSYLQPFSFISSFSSPSPYPVPPFVFFFFNGAPSSPKTSKFLFFCFLLSLFFFSREKNTSPARHPPSLMIHHKSMWMGKREFRPTIFFFNFYWILWPRNSTLSRYWRSAS